MSIQQRDPTELTAAVMSKLESYYALYYNLGLLACNGFKKMPPAELVRIHCEEIAFLIERCKEELRESTKITTMPPQGDK
jgi:hypothetical protein